MNIKAILTILFTASLNSYADANAVIDISKNDVLKVEAVGPAFLVVTRKNFTLGNGFRRDTPSRTYICYNYQTRNESYNECHASNKNNGISLDLANLRANSDTTEELKQLRKSMDELTRAIEGLSLEMKNTYNTRLDEIQKNLIERIQHLPAEIVEDPELYNKLKEKIIEDLKNATDSGAS